MNADVVFRGNATSVDRAANQAVGGLQRVERGAKTSSTQLATATVHSDKLSHSLKHLATLSIGALGLHELVHGLKEAVNAAGDVEKQQSKVLRVFGETPRVLEAFERTSAKAYGISHLAALKAATSTGALLTNLGIGPKLAAGLSVGIQKLSADMGSFNDVPTAAVVQKINTALLGQTRGLKSLGISLSDADVKAKAFSIGLVKPAKSADALRAASDRVTVAEQKWVIAVQKHGKESKEALSAEASLIGARKAQAKATEGVVPPLTAGQKALATYALLLERSQVQQGDFARNQDKLANSSKVLDAEFADLSDRVGNAVEPAVKSLIEFMAGPGIAGANKFLTEFGRDAEQLFHAIAPLAPAGKAAAQGLGAIATVPGLIPTIVGATIAYQGYTRAVGAGAALISSGRGLLGNLASSFQTVGAQAAITTTQLSGAGFTGKLTTTTTAATKGVGPLKAFATNTQAMGLAAGIAVGSLILLESSLESVDAKAKHAASSLLGVQNAQLGLKGAKVEFERTGLAQGDAARALIRAKDERGDAQQRVRTTDPGTDAHLKAVADLIVKTRELKRVQNEYDSAHVAHEQSEAALAKARGDANKATQASIDVITHLAEKQQELASVTFNRGVPGAASQENAEHRKAIAFGRTTSAIEAQIKKTEEFQPRSSKAFAAILDLIKQTGKIPEKKTFRLLLEMAGKGNLDDVRKTIANLPLQKTIRLIVNQSTRPFAPTNPINPTKPPKPSATGNVITEPQLAIVGEEAPAWPEFIVPTNPARRNRAMSLIGQMRSWIPGFAGGAGPPVPAGLAAREAALLRNAKPLAKTAAQKKADADKRPAWMKHWQDDLGSKLPGADAYANAIARAEANLTDAGRTPQSSDDKAAMHTLIKLATKRLGPLHALRSTHKEGIWQNAVDSEISGVGGQLTGYKSSLSDAVKKPGPDDITIGIPGSIKWAIERAELTGDVGAQIRAYTAKQKWLNTQLNARDKKGKYKITGSKATAFRREWTRTGLELNSLGAQKTQADKDAADQAAQDASTPPETPLDIQEALADASLTADTGDDLAALGRQQQFLQGAIAGTTDPTARIALKQALAGVNDQIASIQSGGSSSAAGGQEGPTDDERAIAAQTQRRLDIATRSASLSEAELSALRGSGDIGTGNFGNALGAGAGPAMLITLGDGRSLAALAGGVVQGMGAQASIPANRELVGIR